MSQSFNNGNADVRWTQGAAITAKLEGLWEPTSVVTVEDIRHFQSRVHQFNVLVPIRVELQDTPLCAASWCRWVVADAIAFASRRHASLHVADGMEPPGPPASVDGLSELMRQAAIPDSVRCELQRDVEMLGAVHVRELTEPDWTNLASWAILRPLQQRRILRTMALT